jgi:hypothetical protein
MVSFYDGSYITAALAGTGMANAPTVTPPSSSSSNSANCCCPSSTLFLESLTNKLIAMTTSLKEQFADLKNNQKPTLGPQAPRLVEIQVKTNVSVKYEYIIYLKRYGPPVNGIFDPIYLSLIRAELIAGVPIDHDCSSSDDD